MVELSGLLKSGVPSNEARRLLSQKIENLQPTVKTQFETIWSLALETGGSLSAAIANFGGSIRDHERHLGALRGAFAGPKATSRLVSILPPAGLIVGQVFGLNPIGIAFTNKLAFASLALASILLIFGRLWSNRIIRNAASNPFDPGLPFEAVRLAIASGLPLARAVSASADAFSRNGLETVFKKSEPAIEAIGLVNRSRGASLVELLNSAARTERLASWVDEEARVAKVAVTLMLPLGLVTLPAFVLATILPISIGLLQAS